MPHCLRLALKQECRCNLIQATKERPVRSLPHAFSCGGGAAWRPAQVVPRGGALRGRLLQTRTATAAATRQGVDFEVDGHVATYAASWFDAQREDDAEGLARWSVLFGTLGLILFNLGLAGRLYRAYRALVAHRGAYAYMVPAALGMLVLVFVPVTYGIVLGFMQRRYNEFEFAGLSNYLAILGDFDVSRPDNFYFTLGVTILWTFTNVVLHVSIGLFFALLLNDKLLKARGLFRVLLIVPWAVPNYITALIWKGMFHRQFGVVNHLLQGVGLEPVSWFQTFWPSFSTNVVTNTWLGFPFMMVVSLGALQSIPSDLYEAAVVDGASRRQRFVNITLPLLMPALIPRLSCQASSNSSPKPVMQSSPASRSMLSSTSSRMTRSCRRLLSSWPT